MTTQPGPAHMRLVIHSDDLEKALALYRDALGLPVDIAP